MTDFKDIDKDDSSSDSTETHADELKEDPVPKENRKPIKYEIPITQVNEDDFRDKDGNVEVI